MSAKRSRSEIVSAIRSTRPWPSVVTDGMDPDTEERFINRVKAVDLYAEGDSLYAIEDATEIKAPELHRLIKRCLSIASNGLVRGYQALIPNVRVEVYTRTSPIKPKFPEGKGGYAGAFANLLTKYPDLKLVLVRKVLKLKHERTVYEFRIKPKNVHKEMMDYLKGKNHPKDEWPYGTKLLGSRSIGKFVQQVLDQDFDRNVTVNGEVAAKAHLMVGSGNNALLTFEYMMEAAEIDSYHVDAQFSIGFDNGDGLISYVPIQRINIMALVDRASTAVWWFIVIFSSEVSAVDVVRLLTESLRVNLPRPRKEVLGMNLSGDVGFPGEIFPELAHTIPTVLMPDNALANLSSAVSDVLRKKLGYSLCYGPPGHFEMRPNVERSFKELASQIFQRLPSTTGSSPGSGRAEGSSEVSAHLKIDASLIEELAFYHFALSNATPSEGIGFLSPNEYIRQKLNKDSRHYIPRTVLQENVSKMTNYSVTESVIVRCYPKRGVRPYIQLDRVHYSSGVLKESAWLADKKIIVEVDEDDMRILKAYWPDGSFMENLTACGKWSLTRHSRKTRKSINSLLAQKLLIVSEFDDPIILYMKYLSNVAQGIKDGAADVAMSVAKAATEHKRVEMEVLAGMDLGGEELNSYKPGNDSNDEVTSPLTRNVEVSETSPSPDKNNDEPKPQKTATIIPYPMPDLNKMIKDF